MRLATEMVQGVDVWLNTPRRPWEASGTSGMKVLVNGGLNLSTLDGWWAEAYAPDLGWAVGDRDDRHAADEDARDADQVYGLLERTIVPEFYDRDAGGLPRQWLARIRASMASLTPRFSSVRMLQEYIEQVYLPAAAQHAQRAAGDSAAARELAAWARHLQEHWTAIRFGHPEAASTGRQVTISVPIYLGAIEARAVRVELYAGADGREAATVRPMAPTAPPDGSGAVVYRATIETIRPASHFTPRVVPHHRDARLPIELPLIAWQR
jgi:starch phosphorylase